MQVWRNRGRKSATCATVDEEWRLHNCRVTNDRRAIDFVRGGGVNFPTFHREYIDIYIIRLDY